MSDISLSTALFSYEDVVFPAVEAKTGWGHDSARHQGYKQHGADIEDTGEKPRVVSVKIPLRNGIRWTGPERLYPETYLRLREALKTPEGFLTHPTYGPMTVHVDTVDEGIVGAQGDGIDIDVTFTEQRGETLGLDLALGSTRTPSDAALASATEADTAAEDLTLSTTESLADTLGDAFDFLQEAERTYLEASTVFASLTTDLSARLVGAGAADSDGHDYRVAVSRCLAETLAYRDEYLGADGPETVTLSAEMSLSRAAVLAYGDPSRAAELAAKNRIADPCFIPSGTVLLI